MLGCAAGGVAGYGGEECSCRYRRVLAVLAAAGRRVRRLPGTAVDLLGFGRSPRPDEASYDVECHLHALLPLVAPGSLVVAHSTGAVLASALAVRHPPLVRGLLLIGAPLYRDQADARKQVRRLGLLVPVTVSGHLAGPLTMLLLHSLVRPFSGRLPLDLPAPVVQDFWEHSWTSYSRTLRRMVAGHPAVPDLRRLPVPGTLVYGTDNRSAARRDVHQLVRDRASFALRRGAGRPPRGRTRTAPDRAPARGDVADRLRSVAGTASDVRAAHAATGTGLADHEHRLAPAQVRQLRVEPRGRHELCAGDVALNVLRRFSHAQYGGAVGTCGGEGVNVDLGYEHGFPAHRKSSGPGASAGLGGVAAIGVAQLPASFSRW